MKIRNKRTGEIVEFRYLQPDHVAPLVLTTYENDKPMMYSYDSLAELNEEWEDVPEEPKKYWYISDGGEVYGFSEYFVDSQVEDDHREIDNLFESKEEAEKAVEKLKAWKRLKGKGFRFDNVNGCWIEFTLKSASSDEDFVQGQKDLDLLFGGEE